MGFTAAVLGGTSGMIGVIAASIGATMITKVNMGTGIGQRIALPVSVFCLLLVPLVDDTGRLLCFCAINAVLAHSSVIAWSHTTVENSEFKLHPIKRHASHQIPSWLGFAGGVIIGLVLTRWYPSVGGNEWYIAIVFIISLAVLAFALSLGDDSMIERMLTDLLDNAYATDKNGIEPGTTATAAPEGLPPAPPPGVSALSGTAGPTLEERCSVICESYGLSAREAEVFVLLAQGRSVKRLQEKLFITEATVKSHIYHIYRKMGISNRQGLLDLVERQNDVG
jgi:DNA-binding CsgD family transcriptional regulator